MKISNIPLVKNEQKQKLFNRLRVKVFRIFRYYAKKKDDDDDDEENVTNLTSHER